MSHNTAVRAILGRVRVRVVRVDEEHDPVGAGVASTVDSIPVQEGELVQGLALAFRGERESAVVAEFVRVAACNGSVESEVAW